MKRLLFIYNPHAGRQKARTILPTALVLLLLYFPWRARHRKWSEKFSKIWKN